MTVRPFAEEVWVEPPAVDRLVARVAAFVEREAFPILLVGLAVTLLVRFLSLELYQDGWMTLVSGREVAHHGLPHHETLFFWGHGRPWIDQQWLAQLAFYGLFALGGIKLVMLGNAAILTAAFVLAIAVARLRGASALRTAVVAAVSTPVIAFSWQLRAQTTAYLLFVTVLALLLADSRNPSRRVFLVFPLLVLWANLHGSVLLGCGLVALSGATYAVGELRASERRRRWIARSAALVVGPGLCAFASPYGFALAGYYKSTLFNPAFAKYIIEWQPTRPSPWTVPFFALAGGALWLLGRARRLNLFERVVVVFAALSALAGVRNMIWFALLALVVLPPALEEVWPSSNALGRPRLNRMLALGAAAAALASFAFTAARPLSWLDRLWPPAAAAAVSNAAAQDPSLRIFATAHTPDWLLMRDPKLAGRIALDARLELLSRHQIVSFFQFLNRIGDHWRDAAAGDRLIVLDGRVEWRVEKDLRSRGGIRTLYKDKFVTVLLRDR